MLRYVHGWKKTGITNLMYITFIPSSVIIIIGIFFYFNADDLGIHMLIEFNTNNKKC